MIAISFNNLKRASVKTIVPIIYTQFQPLRCQGIKSDALVAPFRIQKHTSHTHQIAPHKLFEYLAISQVWYNRFGSNYQRITVWLSSSYL